MNKTDKYGQKQGKWEVYRPNDNLRVKCTYVNDELHGEFKEYYHNGDLMVECNYVNGKLDGEAKTYRYESGEIWHIFTYVNGVIQPKQ